MTIYTKKHKIRATHKLILHDNGDDDDDEEDEDDEDDDDEDDPPRVAHKLTETTLGAPQQ